MLQLGLTAFYFLRLLIKFIIGGNNTFGMGVWYGTVVWYGIFVPNHIPNHRTIPGFVVFCSMPCALAHIQTGSPNELSFSIIDKVNDNAAACAIN